MNVDQRKSFRIQIPEGREQATLNVCGKDVGVRILDESAGGYAVALLGDVDIQQNRVHVLKTATGLFQTRVARIEHFSDGQLLGLMRIQDLSETDEKEPQQTSWRDCLFTPRQSAGTGTGSVAAGIGVAAVLGVLVCALVLYGIRYLPATHNPQSSQFLHDYSRAVTEDIVKARDSAAETAKIAQEKQQNLATSAKIGETLDSIRRNRVSAEVLYRLQLTSEQSSRIRSILNRSSNDLAAAEAEIRSILTAEQIRLWQSLAP